MIKNRGGGAFFKGMVKKVVFFYFSFSFIAIMVTDTAFKNFSLGNLGRIIQTC